MPQCLHLDAGGRRCRREAAAGAEFCAWHLAEEAFAESPPGQDWRRLVYRLAALLLLGLFLLPLLAQAYRLLRALLN